MLKVFEIIQDDGQQICIIVAESVSNAQEAFTEYYGEQFPKDAIKDYSKKLHKKLLVIDEIGTTVSFAERYDIRKLSDGWILENEVLTP